MKGQTGGARGVRTLRTVSLVAALATGCGAGTRGEGGAAARAPEGGSAHAFEQVEEEVLHDLAAVDRRIALRARVTPSEDDLRRVALAAVLREDPSVAVIDGAIDPFSFDARARGLETTKQTLARASTGAPSASRASERELLGRLVEAEAARLDEERKLPRSASSLIRAIVETWRAPRNESEAQTYDRWLARRLEEVGASMTSAPADHRLDVVRARELDDALDALEHIAATPGFTKTTQALVQLRDALETAGSLPREKARSEWDVIARSLKAHLGVTTAPDTLVRQLMAVETDLRDRIERGRATAGGGSMDRALERDVFPSAACVDAVPGSLVRSMAAPPEREFACHVRRLVARAAEPCAGTDDPCRGKESALHALAAVHDHVVVALWALDVARGASTIAEAEGKHHLLIPVLADARARYERIALARPVAAIAAGVAARILFEGDPKQRSAGWASLGDAPLDIVERELTRPRP